MNQSEQLFAKARTLIPGGVNSPVRACMSVDADPVFIKSGSGSRLVTVDGRELLDFVMSWGPMILGYAHPEITGAAAEALRNGASFGAPCPAEVDMAEAVCAAVPGVDMVRMVNSGTEATMSALRLARAYTGREKVIKFIGCYHGHADSFLAAAGSGVATLSIPGTPGVPEEVVSHTLLAEYNDLEAVSALFEKFGENIACVIVEPVAGNMGLVLPGDGFLQGLLDLTRKYEALLVFDEVITGFRVAYGGAQSVYGVTPDLTTLGKIIGGGFPVGAYGGRREIMEKIAPVGDVYQAGTLSGNPVAMAAGLATLRLLKDADYQGLERRTKDLTDSLLGIMEQKGVPVCVNVAASMFTLFFTEGPVTDFESAKKSDAAMYARFYRRMREYGVNLAPSGFECAFTSFAHTDRDLEKFLDAARKVEF